MANAEPDAELRELLAIAEAAAAEARTALRRHQEQWSGVTGEEGREVKIEADRRAEALIIDALTRAAPYPIISEERGWVEGQGSYLWAVDPLDGSVNYRRRYPHCAVSVALLRDNKPVLGVVDGIVLEERYAGIVGRGATLNGAPIRVSPIAESAKGILHTGIPAAMDAAAYDAFEARLKLWQKVRMIGSAASALAYVAAGRAEAYRESGSKIWDVAAGCALVEAAGGRAEIQAPGGLEAPLEVAASNGKVDFPR